MKDAQSRFSGTRARRAFVNSSPRHLVTRATNQTTDCRPKACKPQCAPACGSSERCTLQAMRTCGQCPASQCISLSTLQVTNTVDRGTTASKPNTALIAGLTTGLVVAALIVASIVGYVFLRRRTRAKNKPFPSTMSPTVPVQPFTKPESNSLGRSSGTFDKPLPTPNWQGSTRSVGSSSSQPPRLTTTPPAQLSPNAIIRHSLNMGPNPEQAVMLNRSSSVKVTKHDHMDSYAPKDNQFEDLEDGKVQVRRAVSVKKSGNTTLPRSASEGASVTALRRGSLNDSEILGGSQAIQIVRAKPTMVRINTVMRNEGGVTRKRSVRTAIPAQEREDHLVTDADAPSRSSSTDDTDENANEKHSVPITHPDPPPGDQEIIVAEDSPARPSP